MTTKEEARAALEAIRKNQADAQKSLKVIQQKATAAQQFLETIEKQSKNSTDTLGKALKHYATSQENQAKAQTSLGAIQQDQTEAQNLLEAIQQHQAETQNSLGAIRQHQADAQKAWDAIQQINTQAQAMLQAGLRKYSEAQEILEAVKEQGSVSLKILKTVRQKDADAQNTLDERQAEIEKLSTANKEALEELKSTEKQVSDALGDATAAGLTVAFTQAIQVEEKRRRIFWLYGAAIGAGIALAVAGLLLWQQISSPSQLNFWGFISRATAIAIPLAVAWFCGSQYIKLENTLEDYRYKKVLAQSMANFMKQLADVDEERRTYLMALFQQMLQDPLRRKHDVQTPLTPLTDVLAQFRKGKPDDDFSS